MRFRTNLRRDHSLIDLTPLVDVTFLMLIFFIITSDILPLKSLNIENPTLDRDSPPMTTQLLVVMDAQNVIYLGSEKEIVDMVTVQTKLKQQIDEIQTQYPAIHPTVVLSVDRRVSYGEFLRLFSLAQEVSPQLRLVYKPDPELGTEYM